MNEYNVIQIRTENVIPSSQDLLPFIKTGLGHIARGKEKKQLQAFQNWLVNHYGSFRYHCMECKNQKIYRKDSSHFRPYIEWTIYMREVPRLFSIFQELKPES